MNTWIVIIDGAVGFNVSRLVNKQVSMTPGFDVLSQFAEGAGERIATFFINIPLLDLVFEEEVSIQMKLSAIIEFLFLSPIGYRSSPRIHVSIASTVSFWNTERRLWDFAKIRLTDPNRR